MSNKIKDESLKSFRYTHFDSQKIKLKFYKTFGAFLIVNCGSFLFLKLKGEDEFNEHFSVYDFPETPISAYVLTFFTLPYTKYNFDKPYSFPAYFLGSSTLLWC
jgi:hypothetical protein